MAIAPVSPEDKQPFWAETELAPSRWPRNAWLIYGSAAKSMSLLRIPPCYEELSDQGLVTRPYLVFDPTQPEGPGYDPLWLLSHVAASSGPAWQAQKETGAVPYGEEHFFRRTSPI